MCRKGVSILPSVREGSAAWQAHNFIRTNRCFSSSLSTSTNTHEYRTSGSRVIHSPCLIGETRRKKERERERKMEGEKEGKKSLEEAAGLKENRKDFIEDERALMRT